LLHLRGGPQGFLDVLHELLDLEGGALRHLMLQGSDGLDALPVAEAQFDGAAGQQSAADQYQRNNERPAQQPATSAACRPNGPILNQVFRSGRAAHRAPFDSVISHIAMPRPSARMT